jgi:Nif-specific regulatory protein
VRELENCIESAVVLCEGDLTAEHLPLPERTAARSEPKPEGAVRTLAEVERQHVLFVLEKAAQNRTLAARWLGIGRNTLARKLKDFGILGED